MTNYICINGNKTELTEEQLKQLGIELPKVNPFERHKGYHDSYYYIGSDGDAYIEYDDNGEYNDCHFDVANYCTDKAILEQRALHETLNRLLWRYSMEHDGDKIDWQIASKGKWYTYYNNHLKKWCVGNAYTYWDCGVFFYSAPTAQNAIEEIIKPFMAAHPEFKF